MSYLRRTLSAVGRRALTARRGLTAKSSGARLLATALLLRCLLPFSAEAQEVTSDLVASLAAATGGETILLKDEAYGDLIIARTFDREVTIRSETENKAVLRRVEIRGTNIRLENLRIEEGLFATGSNLSVENSIITGFVLFRKTDGLKFTGNHVSNGEHGVFLEGVRSFDISENRIENVISDLMRVDGNSFDGRIANNFLWDMHPKRHPDGSVVHADALQMFGRPEGTPHDIEIRGNLIYDDPETGDRGNLWGQGIFLGGPSDGYRNIAITQNLINVGSPNSIFVVNGLENILISGNTLIPWPDGDGATIRLVDTVSGVEVTDNVAAAILNQGTGAIIGNNYLLSRRAGHPTYFADLLSGPGRSWQDFLPREGSPIDFGSGYGALERLTELAGQ